MDEGHEGGRDPGGPTDAELVVASRSDPARFAAIFERHFDVIFGYLARRVPRADATDLSAETFRVAFGARDRFDPAHTSARPWLYGIASNVLRHHLRRSGREDRALRRLAGLPPGCPPPSDDDVAAAADATTEWRAVVVALGRLAPDDRETLLLFAWEDLTYGEIARATGVPVGTVRSRLNRARRQLRELVEVGGQQGQDGTDRVPEEVPDNG